MGHAAKPIRQNCTITVNFRDETTYSELQWPTRFAPFVPKIPRIYPKNARKTSGFPAAASVYFCAGTTLWMVN